MIGHTVFMERCLALASCGAGLVAPNPMVGCVIVCDGKIIGEGFHHTFGGPHAEVNAIGSVRDRKLLSLSTLYVSLEPCAHYGKTPPCTELIIREKIPRVVIGMRDPNPEVAGRGEQMLQTAGIQTLTGVMEKECRELNRRFITFHEQKRPYVILKWAQTSDGYIDPGRVGEPSGQPVWISSPLSRMLVHRQRSLEGAVLVGTTTALMDNPSLTVRDWSGDNPLRLVIDRTARLPKSLHLFDQQAKRWYLPESLPLMKEKSILNSLILNVTSLHKFRPISGPGTSSRSLWKVGQSHYPVLSKATGGMNLTFTRLLCFSGRG